MRIATLSLLVAVLAGAALALPPSSSVLNDRASTGDFDLTNTGQHDPQLGAAFLAGGIGSLDAQFDFCGWPKGEWAPVRARALNLALKVYLKAGLKPQDVQVEINRMRDLQLKLSAQHPKRPQCLAMEGGPSLDRRAIRWMRGAMEWGAAYLKS